MVHCTQADHVADDGDPPPAPTALPSLHDVHHPPEPLRACLARYLRLSVTLRKGALDVVRCACTGQPFETFERLDESVRPYARLFRPINHALASRHTSVAASV